MNPERSLDVLEQKFNVEFQKRVAAGSKRPLLVALVRTFKKEFLLGAFCQLMSTIAMTISPFLLRFLIAFATEAFNAKETGGRGPNIGYGVGLVVIITALQVMMTFSINHFMYWGMTVGGEARAVLMSLIFAKSLRISGRAKAGGYVLTPPTNAKPGSDDEKRWYQKALPKGKGTKDKKVKPSSAIGSDTDGWSNGRIVNLMSTDTYRIDQASGMIHMLWGSPLSIIITMVLLLINLGYSALPGLGLLFMCTPALTAAIRALFKRRFAINKITDQRVSLTSEILQSIRFVKFFGWETSFLQRVQEIRKREIRSIQILLAIRDAIQALAMAIPVFASMLSFITYALTSHSLSPAPIFSSLALFNGLRMPLNSETAPRPASGSTAFNLKLLTQYHLVFPMVVGNTIDGFASIKRIQEFLLAEEASEDVDQDPSNENAIVVKDATFTWEKTQTQGTDEGTRTPDSITLSEPFSLPSLTLTAGRSELIGVIGSVGSGKTSLLAALAGDMRKLSGSVTFGASRAFCPQYAWIQNATVRDNITFGKEFDREWYDAVTEACALRTDFAMLPNGDKTEIGERGITVSGGQKQRINIARAIYFNADIVLMDDPLSAVDAHVGRHIMDSAICGLLANKCRILATHQLHVLHRCDRIIWLDGGCIKAQGSYQDLVSQNKEFVELMTLTSANEETAKNDDSDEESLHVPDENEKLVKVETAKSNIALMQAEERAVKAVSWSVYGAWLRAGGSILIAPLVIVLLILSQGSNIVTSLWLSWWTADQFPLTMGEWVRRP